jgi:hypothetical protein
MQGPITGHDAGAPVSFRESVDACDVCDFGELPSCPWCSVA